MTPWRRHTREDPRSEPWVRVTTALHQPEAEMLADMLRQGSIPCLIRRTTIDVPDMLAGGPREILVPPHALDSARAVLGRDEPTPPDPSGDV